MKSFLILFLLIAINIQAYAQQDSLDTGLKWGAKAGLFYRNYSPIPYVADGIKGPAVAFMRKKGNSFQELELAYLESSKSNSTRITSIAIRIQHNMYLVPKGLRVAKPYLGIGIWGEVGNRLSIATTANQYDVVLSDLLTELQVAPGLQISLGRTFLDFNFPLALGRLSNSVIQVNNPNWSPQEQRTSSYAANVLPLDAFNMRAGIGLWL